MTEPKSPLVTLGFINAGHFFTHLLMLLYATVVLKLDREFGLSYGNLITLSLPAFLLFGAGALPAGWLGDRWSARGMLALFFFGGGLSAIATGLARSPLGIAVGLGAIGLFASIYHPVGTAWLVRIAHNRGRALGINGVFGNLGVAFAASVAGALTTLVHWRAAFIVPGAAALLIGTIFLLVVPSGRGRVEAESRHGPSPSASREMWRVFAVITITAVAGGIVYHGTSVALPKLFDDRMADLAQTSLGVGGLVTVVYVVGSLAQIVMGFLMDRFPLKTLYLLVNVVQVPLLLAAVGYRGLPLLVTMQAAVFFSMGSLPMSDLILARHTPIAWRGTVYGVKFVLALGVSAAAVSLVGLLRDYTGSFSALLLAFVGFLTVVALATLFLPRERGAVLVAEPAPQPAAGTG